MNTSPILIQLEPPCDTLSDPSAVSRPGPQNINPAGGDKAPAAPKRSLHILCIDDDEQILELMKDCLSCFEHQVRVASGGRHGVELFCTAILKSEPYDVVITDLRMPDMDGYQVARAIKDESPATPIILMTGEGGKTIESKEMTAAVDAVVGKPPQMQELNSLLLRLANRQEKAKG